MVWYVQYAPYPCSAMRVRLGFWKGLYYNGRHGCDDRGIEEVRMTTTVEAIYEQGVLRLIQPLSLQKERELTSL